MFLYDDVSFFDNSVPPDGISNFRRKTEYWERLLDLLDRSGLLGSRHDQMSVWPRYEAKVEEILDIFQNNGLRCRQNSRSSPESVVKMRQFSKC